jgi:hypothetical protein
MLLLGAPAGAPVASSVYFRLVALACSNLVLFVFELLWCAPIKGALGTLRCRQGTARTLCLARRPRPAYSTQPEGGIRGDWCTALRNLGMARCTSLTVHCDHCVTLETCPICRWTNDCYRRLDIATQITTQRTRTNRTCSECAASRSRRRAALP